MCLLAIGVSCVGKFGLKGHLQKWLHSQSIPCCCSVHCHHYCMQPPMVMMASVRKDPTARLELIAATVVFVELEYVMLRILQVALKVFNCVLFV